jgi:hypothetical protein
LPARHGVAKRGSRDPASEFPMAILMIAAFIIVMAALNRFEFGRFD